MPCGPGGAGYPQGYSNGLIQQEFGPQGIPPGARMIEDTAATHIVMDDGLQNPGLTKDLSLAMIDGARWIGNGRVIPAGPLRAALPFQAGLVDALVVGNSGPMESVLPDSLKRIFSCPVLQSRWGISHPFPHRWWETCGTEAQRRSRQIRVRESGRTNRRS